MIDDAKVDAFINQRKQNNEKEFPKISKNSVK